MSSVLGVFRLLVVGLLILLIFLATLVYPMLPQPLGRRVLIRLARWVVPALGVQMKVHGQLPADIWTKGYMVCANHISFVDIFVLQGLMPVRFVAKKEIDTWPMFGMIARRAGTIFIDRTRRRALLEVGQAMKQTLQAHQNVMFFPEGTTGPGDRLLPFHANLFSVACETESAVLPIGLKYTVNGQVTTLASYADEPLGQVLRRIVSTSNLGVEVYILSPIETANVERRQVCSQLEQAMQTALQMDIARDMETVVTRLKSSES